MRPFRRSPGAQLLLERAYFPDDLREFRAKAPRLPDLKLVAQADKGDLVLDAGVSFQRFGEDRPPLAVDLQHLARAIEGRRKLFAALRIWGKARGQRLDFPEQ